VLFAALKQRVKAVVDDSRQVGVLEEGNVVNVLILVFGLFRSHPSLGDVDEDVGEIGLDDLFHESPIVILIELLK
jgi:hypothetical protein